jgi:arylsulfatase
MTSRFNLFYSAWCTNEKELYNLQNDPGQLQNLHGTSGIINGVSIPRLETRLDALLMVLKSCKGKQCIHPWNTLHPQGNVKNLGDALNDKFDQFYANQPKISFTACADGYILALEGPQNVIAFGL